MRAAREQGAVTVAIVNDETSPLAQTAEWVLACLAGPELSIPATKTVTAQMTLLALLSAALEQPDRPAEALHELPAALRLALELRPAASTLAAFSTTSLMLIATRALLGLAGAALAPSTLSLLRTMFEDEGERTRAIGVWGASFAAGEIQAGFIDV